MKDSMGCKVLGNGFVFCQSHFLFATVVGRDLVKICAANVLVIS